MWTLDDHEALARAMTLLQLQQELVDSLVAELARTRADRDEARQIRALLEALINRRIDVEPRVCRCGALFTPTLHHTRVCPACRRAHCQKAAAASRAAAQRRAGQETPSSSL